MNHLNFVWDPVKARRNVQKYGISFQEATSVFDDPLALIFEDARYAYGECREIIIGHDRQNRLMLVCFVEQPTVIMSSNHPTDNTPSFDDDDLLPEYNFDYSKARPNRFAQPMTVVLDPDLAEVFPSSESVNQALRELLRQRRS